MDESEELGEIVSEFLAESRESLDRLGSDLVELGRDPGSRELLAGVFRTIHTIKGISGLLAFGRLESVTHVGESLLARLREGTVSMTPATTDVLLTLVDRIRELLAAIEDDGTEGAVDVTDVVARITDLLEGRSRPGPVPSRDRIVPRPADRAGAALAMAAHRQPIDHLWTRVPRLVRGLGADCGKQVGLVMVGRETELDRSVLESVKDPLIHLVRNAVDHGIESPAQRVAAGKPAEGLLTLRASHQGEEVVVEVSDDGAGIDPGRIAAQAVDEGLRTPAQVARMSRPDILRLILAPGLSTAATVTHVSGRGVGMDVVRTNIEGIGGTVEVESVLGRGTTCRLRIPRALGIVPAQ